MNPPLDPDQLIAWYTIDHLTTAQIGERVARTRARISQILRQHGITRAQGSWVSRSCGYCKAPVLVRRCLARKTIESFCHAEHYYASRENTHGLYHQFRTGNRRARAAVATHFDLQSHHIVHHKDGNDRNNDLANLAVYASQADHLAAHHGKRRTTPLWDGSLTT